MDLFSRSNLVRFSLYALLTISLVGGASAETFEGFEDGNYDGWSFNSGDGSDVQVQSNYVIDGSYSLLFDVPDGDSELTDMETPSWGSYTGDYGYKIRKDSGDNYLIFKPIDSSGTQHGYLRFEQTTSEGIKWYDGSNFITLESSYELDKTYKIIFKPDYSSDTQDIFINGNQVANDVDISQDGSPSNLDKIQFLFYQGNRGYLDTLIKGDSFNNPPQFNSSSISPDPPLIGEASDVSYTVTDDTQVSNVTVEWFYNGTEQATQTNSYSSSSVTDTLTDFYTPQNEGNHTIYFTAVDDQGASTTTTIEREVTLDLPSISSWTTPSEGQSYSYASTENNADIEFNWDVTWDAAYTDGVTEIQINNGTGFTTEASINQATSGTQSYSQNISLSEGTYDVRLNAEQNNGADTTTTSSRSITVSQDTQAPEITLSTPNNEASFNYGPSESGANVDFEWFVQAYEESGTTRLYINDLEESSKSYSSFASNSFTYNQTLSEGTYEYYVTANSDSHSVTSPTRTFTVTQQDINVDFTLTEPSNNQLYNTAFGTEQTVNYDGGVSTGTSGTINLIRDGTTLATESHPGSASVPISATEDLGEGVYEWVLEFEYDSTENQLTNKIVDFEDGQVDPFEVFGETVPTSTLFLESTDAISGTNSLYFEKNTERQETKWDLEEDSDIDITTVESLSFTTNTYELQSVSGAANQYEINIENQGQDDIVKLQIDDDDTNNELDLVIDQSSGSTILENGIDGQDIDIELLFDETNMQVEVLVNGASQGTYDLQTADTSLNVAEIVLVMEAAEGATNDGRGALFDDFNVSHVTEQTVSKTITSTANNFEVVEEQARDPVINLDTPNDGEVINLNPGTTSSDVDFDWSVEGYDETGNTTLYVNGTERFNDSFASFANNPYSHTENLSVGAYEYYVEASTPTRTVTSNTRSFTVNERDMARPDFSLTKPEDNAEVYVDGSSSGEVDFEFGVSAETDGNLFLEVSEPGTTNYTSLYNESVTGLTSEAFNTTQEFTGIDYNQEYNGFNETENYNWRLRFGSTETDDEFTSSANSFTFTEEQVTTADGIVSRIIGFFGDYWEAFMSGTDSTGKAFIGLVLMLLVGGAGYALAGTTAASLGMVTMFLINTVIGLFPAWIALAIVISILGYIFIFRGE